MQGLAKRCTPLLFACALGETNLVLIFFVIGEIKEKAFIKRLHILLSGAVFDAVLF